MSSRLFPALLVYWRRREGLSQWDLAMRADVSARHLSFLESGRARPSEAMVLRLMSALAVPLRDQNEALRAAGFAARFPEPDPGAMSPAVERAVGLMLEHQEPYPLTLLSADYRILRSNPAAARVLGHFVADPARLAGPLDMFTLLFDPALARPFVEDWPALAAGMVARLHREALRDAGDERLAGLLDRVLQLPGVSPDWRRPDFAVPSDAVLGVRLRRGDVRVGFLTTVTVFSAPGTVTLEELRIESYFPLDDATEAFCTGLTGPPRPR